MTTMRLAGTSRPKRCWYQWLMRSRSWGRPVACVYWVTPSRSAFSAACTTNGAAVKSGSPMLRNSMGESLRATSRASAVAALATSIT